MDELNEKQKARLRYQQSMAQLQKGATKGQGFPSLKGLLGYEEKPVEEEPLKPYKPEPEPNYIMPSSYGINPEDRPRELTFEEAERYANERKLRPRDGESDEQFKRRLAEMMELDKIR